MNQSIAIAKRLEHQALTKAAQSLLGICSGLIADGHLSDGEIMFLRTWLTENSDVTTMWPGDVIHARINAVLADGVIDDEERASLLDLLKSISGNEFHETGSASISGPAVPFDDADIVFDGSTFCLTGTFAFGTRNACEQLVESLGGTISPVTGKLDYLVVGAGCSASWANTTYGRKIEAAIERKRRYGKPAIVPERAWLQAAGKK